MIKIDLSSIGGMSGLISPKISAYMKIAVFMMIATAFLSVILKIAKKEGYIN